MIHREDAGDVAVLRLEHGKANAIDIDLFDELDERLEDALASKSGRAMLTGEEYDPDTLQRIARFLEKTVGKKG